MNFFIIIILSLIFLLVFFILLKIQNLKKSIDENINKKIAIINKNNLEKKDKMLDLQDIKTISLVDNNTSKEIINFKKTDMGKITEFKYRELSTTGNLASSIASTAVMDSMLKIANPNGFFTATVNPSTLMEYTKGVGGLSSIVQGSNGKIISHSGFINASVFTPIVAFQILSFATGQYYLHGINKQLSKILNKLDDLQFFIESEDFAKINFIQEELLNLSNKKNCNSTRF